jgi:hypothetical protein
MFFKLQRHSKPAGKCRINLMQVLEFVPTSMGAGRGANWIPIPTPRLKKEN